MVPLTIQLQNPTLRGVLTRLHFPLEVMLVNLRWNADSPLNLRNLEEGHLNDWSCYCDRTIKPTQIYQL